MVATAKKIPAKKSENSIDELIGSGAESSGGEGGQEGGRTVEVGEVIDASFEVVPDSLPTIPELQAEITRLTGELSLRDKLQIQISSESLSVDRAASEVLRCESAVEEAKGDLKSAKERYDKRVNALRDLVRDMATGQGRLDFDSATPGQMQDALVTAAAMALDPAATAPVSELGKKKLKEIVGADVFNNAKDIGEPIGLSDGQVETIEGDGFLTIADLEKKLQKYPLFLTDLKGFGPTAQGRMSMSLAAWRKVNPEPVVGSSAEVSVETAVDADTPADDGVQRAIYRGDGTVVEGGVDQMAKEITESFK